MLNRKWRQSALAIVLGITTLVAAACGNSNNGANDAASEPAASSAAPSESAAESAKPAEVKDIKFYGKIVEFTSGEPMVAELQEELKDKYKIEAIQVDWGNLEKVIKTGIASGSPADVYQFWPGQMKTFVEGNQALDLTPYLEANGGEWKNTFNQGLLDMGKYDGKYYNLPLSSVFSVLYVNSGVFEKAGVAVPDTWSWEEFVAACATIKDKTGVFPFGLSKDLQDWLYRNGTLSMAKGENKLAEFIAGSIPSPDPIYSEPLKKIKDLYDQEYWYPGKGALTVSRDEVKAAFMQGKVAMLAEVSANVKSITEEAKDFKVVTVNWPSMGKESAILGGADGLFIPANAPNKEEAVEVLKTYLGDKVQAIHGEHGYATANVNVKVADPGVVKVLEFSKYISNEVATLSPKLSDFIFKEITASYVLGDKSEKDLLDKLEQLRAEALGGK